MINQRLLTQNYDFFIKDNIFYVRFLEGRGTHPEQEPKDIVLNVQPEIIGIIKTDDDLTPWSVVIVTPSGLKKLKNNITETLETIGFQFRTLDDALEAHRFITTWMYELETDE